MAGLEKAKKIKHNIFTYLLLVIMLLFFAFAMSRCVRAYFPSEHKGYYKPLIVYQYIFEYKSNERYAENRNEYRESINKGVMDPELRYHFEIEGTDYYIQKDNVYTGVGAKISELYPKSEGYFINGGNLYYVYGEEKSVGITFVRGGTVNTTLKNFKYMKLNILANEEVSINKEEYEEYYFKLEEEFIKSGNPQVW